MVNVVQENVILSRSLQHLGMLNAGDLGSRRLVAEQNGHVQLSGQVVLLLVVDHQTLLVVALVVAGVVVDGSGERIRLVAGQVSVHDGDDVIRVKLVVRQHTVHVGNIGLVSVVVVAGGTSEQDSPFGGRGQGDQKNKGQALHLLQINKM